MVERLGQQLRDWRQAQGLSLRQLADRAQVGKSTLNNWENGAFEPRLPELEATLTALGVSSEEREQALSLMTTRRGMAARQQTRDARFTAEIGQMPGGGDLLRALRHRKRWRLEQAADALGVSPGTLSRWEQGKVMPAPEGLDALLTILGASPQEHALLSDPHRFSSPFSCEPADSPDALWERFLAHMLLVNRHTEDALGDLRFLTLEAQAWRSAAQGNVQGRRILAHICAEHAAFLACYQRLGEAGTYAHRALNLISERTDPPAFLLAAAIVAADADVYRSASPSPRRGLERLRLWLPYARQPDYRAWILQQQASYLRLQGETESALDMNAAACRIAERCVNPEELLLRRIDRASLLVQAGRAGEALAFFTLGEDDNVLRRVQTSLLATEAYQALGDRRAAHDCLQRAYTDICAYSLPQFQARADALAQ